MAQGTGTFNRFATSRSLYPFFPIRRMQPDLQADRPNELELQQAR